MGIIRLYTVLMSRSLPRNGVQVRPEMRTSSFVPVWVLLMTMRLT